MRRWTRRVLSAGEHSAPSISQADDILDVWFDSGSTFSTCARLSRGRARVVSGGSHEEAEAPIPRRSAQHRGWFHSSR